MEFKYAIFDLDMTLIDSIIPLRISANLLAREFGLREVTYEEVKAAEKTLPNATYESLWQTLWGRYEPAWFEVYRDRLAESEFAAMKLFPGGRETLEALRDLGVVLGLASNRDRPRRALAVLGIEPLFQAVVGQLDVPRPKPAPDMLLKALELLKARPEEAVYVCDSKGDLLCSAAAGVRAFSVTTGGHDQAELSALGAWRVGSGLPDVLKAFSN